MTKKISKTIPKKYLTTKFMGGLFVIIVVAGIGLHYLLVSRAASPFASAQAETGTRTSPATVVANSAASGGSYVQFGTVTTTTPPPTTGGVPLLGFSTGGGQDPQDMQDTALLGKKVQLGEFFLDGGSYTNSGWNMGISLSNYISYWKSYPYRLIISIPTLDSTSTLATCATGAYNTYYTQMGKNMVSLGYPNSIVRLGWEFNGTWYGNQDANTNPSAWIKCFQNESSALKAADPKVLIDFNPTEGEPAYNGNTPFNWASVYPGDQYVDIIGLDTYDNGGAYPAGKDNTTGLTAAQQLTNEENNWNNIVNNTGGLQDQVNFATAHNKLLSIPEWGLDRGAYNDQDGGDDPYYIQQMYNWITSHHYYYESYFNVKASDGDHYLSDFPNSKAEFTKLFTPLVSESPNNVAPVK